MSLEVYSTSALEEELERRSQLPVPNPVERNGRDWSKIEAACERYITELHGELGDGNDQEHYIFEAALEAIYGEGVWSWVNDKLK
jgi:hypothetical protein